MDARNCSQGQLRIVVDATNGPDSANIAQLGLIEDLSTLITIEGIRGYT